MEMKMETAGPEWSGGSKSHPYTRCGPRDAPWESGVQGWTELGLEVSESPLQGTVGPGQECMYSDP